MRISRSASFASYPLCRKVLQTCLFAITTRHKALVEAEITQGPLVIQVDTCATEATALQALLQKGVEVEPANIEWIDFGHLLQLAKCDPRYWARDNHPPEVCEARAAEMRRVLDPEGHFLQGDGHQIMAALYIREREMAASRKLVLAKQRTLAEHSARFHPSFER